MRHVTELLNEIAQNEAKMKEYIEARVADITAEIEQDIIDFMCEPDKTYRTVVSGDYPVVQTVGETMTSAGMENVRYERIKKGTKILPNDEQKLISNRHVGKPNTWIITFKIPRIR